MRSKTANPFEKYYSKNHEGNSNTTVEFMFFTKPLQENKFVNKSGMPIPKNMLKLFPNIFYIYICHLISLIYKLDNQFTQILNDGINNTD